MTDWDAVFWAPLHKLLDEDAAGRAPGTLADVAGGPALPEAALTAPFGIDPASDLARIREAAWLIEQGRRAGIPVRDLYLCLRRRWGFSAVEVSAEMAAFGVRMSEQRINQVATITRLRLQADEKKASEALSKSSGAVKRSGSRE